MDNLSAGHPLHAIEQLFRFLQEIATHPQKFVADDDLIAGLRSQGAMAKLAFPDRGITATSLNTVKRHSDKWITGGFNALDVAREHALEALDRAKVVKNVPRRRTKLAMVDEMQELRRRIDQATSDNVLLTGAIGTAIRLMRDYAEKSNEAATLLKCEKDISDLLRMFCLDCQKICESDEKGEGSGKS